MEPGNAPSTGQSNHPTNSSSAPTGSAPTPIQTPRSQVQNQQVQGNPVANPSATQKNLPPSGAASSSASSQFLPVRIPINSNSNAKQTAATGPKAKRPIAAMAISFNGSHEDECKSMLLKLLFAFHQANTAEEVIEALNGLFSWIKTQTYNPSPSTERGNLPQPATTYISIPLLRHAKNEFIQCAQIKQRRQPHVWSNSVAQIYTSILQHLLLSIQHQTNLEEAQRLQHARAGAIPRQNLHSQQNIQQKLQQEILQQQIQQRMQMNLSQAHAQFSRNRMDVKPSPKPRKQPGPLDANAYNTMKSTPTVPLASPLLQYPQAKDLYVDMTLRAAQSGGDDEQLYIPQRNITKVMRTVLPKETKIKIDDDAKDLIQECVTEFMLYLTSETRDQAVVHKRNKAALTGYDAVKAMYNLGFTAYGDIMSIYNEKIIQVQKEASRTKSEKRLAKQKGLLNPTNPPDAASTESAIPIANPQAQSTGGPVVVSNAPLQNPPIQSNTSSEQGSAPISIPLPSVQEQATTQVSSEQNVAGSSESRP